MALSTPVESIFMRAIRSGSALVAKVNPLRRVGGFGRFSLLLLGGFDVEQCHQLRHRHAPELAIRAAEMDRTVPVELGPRELPRLPLTFGAEPFSKPGMDSPKATTTASR